MAVSSIVNMEQDENGHGIYFEGADYFFLAVNGMGLVANILLYFLDLKYYGGVLDKVD